MTDINFQRVYILGVEYDRIKERAGQVLKKYLEFPDIYQFNNKKRSIAFSTERLIPATIKNRPQIMLLFSNPHPYSIHQGMFLSPNTRGRENLFWSIMEDAGWIMIAENNLPPRDLADFCIRCEYGGPFNFIFYCYYSFPTFLPEDIKKIFGREFYSNVIEPESIAEFRNVIQDSDVQAVVTFNIGIFNHVSRDHIDRYIHRLVAGEVIQSEIEGIEKSIPIFLTYPTGFYRHKQYRRIRRENLDSIRKAIIQ